MSPIVLTIMQGAFLLLLYLFVWGVARYVVRDLRAVSAPVRPPEPVLAVAPAAAAGPAPRGAGGTGQRARELIVQGARGGRVALDGRDVLVGRSGPADLVIDDPYTSDPHARVALDGGGWVVTDLGSTNGTFVNGARVTSPTPFDAGDELTFGQVTVEVRP